jgi:hypothetical protein
LNAAAAAALVLVSYPQWLQAVAPLRKEFDELRDAIKRNAQWMLQTA